MISWGGWSKEDGERRALAYLGALQGASLLAISTSFLLERGEPAVRTCANLGGEGQESMSQPFLEIVRVAARSRVLFLPHAIQQMSRPDRMISPAEVKRIIFAGEIIEDYPEDARGHSCLLLGRGDGNRPIHVVCSPKDQYLAIITAYLPAPGQWSADYRRRLDE